MKKTTLAFLLVAMSLSGCKYYGSAVRPDYPMSMDNALTIARDKQSGSGGLQREIVRQQPRPNMERPAYIPEKEMAVVAPPKTLLVWHYPHVTDDNTRVFGNWSTIFLTDRYEWVLPANEMPFEASDDYGAEYGQTLQ